MSEPLSDERRAENHQLRTARSIIDHERDALNAENVELTAMLKKGKHD